MIQTRKQIGALGEGIATRHLEKKGFSIKDRNYWKKWGEVDIVAYKKGKWHFVEVKTVSQSPLRSQQKDSYRPEDNVHPQKLTRLSRAIESYLAEKNIDKDWQIDVVTVYVDIQNKRVRVGYIENIVLS